MIRPMPDITPGELYRRATITDEDGDAEAFRRAADTIERQAERVVELEQQVAALRADSERWRGVKEVFDSMGGRDGVSKQYLLAKAEAAVVSESSVLHPKSDSP